MRYALASGVVLAAAGTATAGPAVAYVDEVIAAGGVDHARARTFAAASVRRGGLEPRFAEPDTAPCGDDGACLAERARIHGAAVALRLTIVEVGARVVVSLLAGSARGDVRREVVPAAELERADDRIASALRELGPPPDRRSRAGALLLAGTAAALAIGGGAATWYAHDLQARFYADHVAPNGDVFGISPVDARAEERRARRWSLAGGLALGGAALAGTGAALLFVRGAGGEPRPAGLAVAWELP
jgi:hypothetical protein